MEKQLVVFELGAEHFGVEIASVEAIVKVLEITKIPRAPAFIEGVANLRGQVIPIIDLRKRFEMPEEQWTNASRIIVANVGVTKIGMIVSAVSEVITADDSSIEIAPSLVSTINTAYITGIAKLEKHMVVLLDLAKILTSDELTKTAKIAKV